MVDFLVIGGGWTKRYASLRAIPKSALGVVGLAIAQQLSQRFPTKSTFLVERHLRAGEEIRYACVFEITGRPFSDS